MSFKMPKISVPNPVKKLNKPTVVDNRTKPPVPSPITIEVRVYRLLDMRSIWHTGTILRQSAGSQAMAEYYFHVTNRVENCNPGGFNAPKHRTITRVVQGDWTRVMGVFEEVRKRWNGTRYDLFKHNCNFFTDDLLKSLGVSGLDKEYLESSGLRSFLASIPGSSTVQEILKPVFGAGQGTPLIDQALKNDIVKYFTLFFPGLPVPQAIDSMERQYIEFRQRPGLTVSKGAKHTGGQIATGAKHVGGQISSGAKSIGKSISKW